MPVAQRELGSSSFVNCGGRVTSVCKPPRAIRTRLAKSDFSVTARMVPTRHVDLVEVRGGDEGFDGRRIHVPRFAEARSIASNSVSLKRQPSASRLALA